MGGSRSNSIPGGTHRRGPANCTGEARSLQIGSRRTLSPAICIRKLVWPIQVSVNCSGSARGVRYDGSARVKTPGSGSVLRGLRRRSTTVHLRKSRNPCIAADGHGFLNPPSGRWWLGMDISGFWTSAQFRLGEIFLEMLSRLHAHKCSGNRK